jgi:hypothetical protein
LRRLPRTRSSQRNKKRLIFLPRVVVNQATINIVVVHIATIIKATGATATITNPTILIETINAMITLNAKTRNQTAPSPMTRRMITSAITPRKRATRPCIMTSPLCRAQAIHPEEGVLFVQNLLCALVLGLTLAQAAGATTTTMWPKMTAGQIRPSSMGTRTPPRVTMVGISIALTRALAFLPPSPLQLGRKVKAPRNRELCQ